MNTLPLVEGIDPEILETIDARANEIAQGASVDGKIAALLALGSIPIALGALAKDAYGQTPAAVLDALQFALLLEQLENEFYQRGMAATGLIDAADRTIFSTIAAHEAAHVTGLQGLISTRGATPNPKPAFDFTAKGNLPGFNFAAGQYETYKALAQAFEDTGVRAYKGQAPNLMSDKLALSAALSIHSVEARHAAVIRRLRTGANGQLKGWITLNNRDGLPAFTQGIYDGEELVTQGGVLLSTLPDAANNGGANAQSEAFDEPLTKAQVTAIVTPFLA